MIADCGNVVKLGICCLKQDFQDLRDFQDYAVLFAATFLGL